MTEQAATLEQVKQVVISKLAAGEIDEAKARAILTAYKAKQTPAEPMGLVEGTVKSVTGALKEIPSTLLGVGETVAQLGTGAAAVPISGLAGVAALPFGSETSAKVVEGVQESMTYQPRTESGQQVTTAVGKALTPLGKILTKASEISGEGGYRGAEAVTSLIPGDSMQPEAIAGAIGYAIPELILEILGLKGTKAAKGTALKKHVESRGPDDILTPEVTAALQDQGFSLDEIAGIAQADPTMVERLQRFHELEIQPTLGDITQKTEQRKAEQQLMETGQGESAEQMRSLKRQQDAQIETNLNALIDQSVDNVATGAAIKDALTNRKTMTEDAYRDAYKALAEAQKGVDGVPVLIDDFKAIDGIPDAGELREIQTLLPNQYNALMDTLAEFGINQDPKTIEKLLAAELDIQHLSLSNFERLRKRLGNLESADDTGNLGRIIGPVRRELDDQIDLATKTLENSPDANIANLAKEARRNYQNSRIEFDPKGLADELTRNAPRSVNPAVYASQTLDKVLGTNVPIEKVDDLIQSLKAQGKLGEAAISNMQSSVIMDLLDSAFKGTTNKIGDQRMFSPAAFERRLNQLDKNGKLKLIFQDNPRGYRALMQNAKAMQDLTPGKLEMVKGSGGTILDIANTLGLAKVMTAIPGGPALLEQMRDLNARSKNRKTFNAALNIKPAFKQTTDILTTGYPSLAAVLGIGYLSGLEGEE
jgi:hypothetical protein